MLNEKGFYEKPYSDEENYVYLSKDNMLAKSKHFHNRFEMLYIVSGEVDVVINDVIYHATTDDIVIVNTLENHCYINETKDVLAYVLVLGENYLKDFTYKNKFKKFPTLLNNKQANKKVKEWFAEWREKGTQSVMYNIGYFSLIMATCEENYSLYELDNESIKEYLFNNISIYIKEHYNEHITQSLVAKKIGYSLTYFSSMFNEIMGMSFRQYLNTVRMKEAHRIMSTTDKSNEEVAFEVGFNSLSSFYRAKRVYDKKK